MRLSDSIQVYLKTAESCQLNCRHCFTEGANAPSEFFDPEKTVIFFENLKIAYPNIQSIRYNFHGGEPMLAPLGDMYQVARDLKGIFPNTSFGMQTNLVYKLTEEKKTFLNQILMEDGFGTSWDYDIRFQNSQQLALWEENVRTLIKEGHKLTMIVSISKKLIEEKKPEEILDYAIDLGFPYILFERITADGNAKDNLNILPSNEEQDKWLHEMFNVTLEKEYYNRIDNMLLSEVAEAYVYRKHVGNRCRNCEQSLITINANGTISGCPNSAPNDYWGDISLPVVDSFSSRKRLNKISCELGRNPVCYSCPAYQFCNGDCYKLKWDGDICAAPKSIWKQMIKDKDYDRYKKLLIN